MERKVLDLEEKKKSNSLTYGGASVAAIVLLFGVRMYLAGNGFGMGEGNVPAAVEVPSTEPGKEATIIIAKPGEISTIKGEEIQGDTTQVSPEVTETIQPVEPTVAPTEVPVSGEVEPQPPLEQKFHKVEKGDTLGSRSDEQRGGNEC